MALRKVNEELYIASADVVCFDSRYVNLVKESALKISRGRSRICAHRDSSDSLHEMLIAIRLDSYIHPHRHHFKVESFHLVEGSVDVIIFNDDGTIADVIELSNRANFYYRLDSCNYHTLIIHSSVLVIHETTNGPFDPAQSDLATFAPNEGTTEATSYVAALRKSVQAWKASRQVGFTCT